MTSIEPSQTQLLAHGTNGVTSAATRFLGGIFDEVSGDVIYLCRLKNADNADGAAPVHLFMRDRDPAKIDAFVKKYDQPGYGLYYAVSTLTSNANRRAKETVSELLGLHCDIDFKGVVEEEDEIRDKLDALTLAPSKIVRSGNGLHVYYLLATSLPSTTENIAMVEELLRLLARHLAGDPAPAHVAALMRLPGSHNSKGGAWTPVEEVLNDADAQYKPDELFAWLRDAAPVLTAKAAKKTAKAGANGESEANPFLDFGARAAGAGADAPVDVEARLAGMQHQGAGDNAVHVTQRDVSASLLSRGVPLADVVQRVLDATRAAAGAAGGGWDWGAERAKIEKMCRDWVAKTQPGGSAAETRAGGKPAATAVPGILMSARASSFELAAITWLWPDRFALGKVGLLVGLPDEGKGQILCSIIARVTTGGDWPCGEGTAPLGSAILLSAEDAPNDTVVPRLIAAGADLDKVEIVTMVRMPDHERMFSLASDLKLLRQKVEEVGNVKLVVIDPISAYLGVGKIDSFRTTDVRAVLAPVVSLADELGVSIIGIMHFNKKVDVTNTLLRISDSLAFGATARHVFAAVDDPGNQRKLMVRGKNNLARRDISALAYGFGVKVVGVDGKTGVEIVAPHVEWLGPVDVTASEAMQAAQGGGAPAARDDAKTFLTDFLADGPRTKAEIDDAAGGNGISERTLRRAKNELKVAARRDGPDGTWRWHLPARWGGEDDR